MQSPAPSNAHEFFIQATPEQTQQYQRSTQDQNCSIEINSIALSTKVLLLADNECGSVEELDKDNKPTRFVNFSLKFLALLEI